MRRFGAGGPHRNRQSGPVSRGFSSYNFQYCNLHGFSHKGAQRVEDLAKPETRMISGV
jgi:hypothetical protein